MGEKLETTPHAIMIAQPYQGHLNAFVHLAIKLATKGITITFINTEFVHHHISKSHHIYNSTTATLSEDDIFFEARKSGLDIRYTTISDGFPLEFDRDVNVVEYWEALMHDFPLRVEQFVGGILESIDSSFSPFLIADTFGAWPGIVANKYNLVIVSFWTMPAVVFAIDYHRDLLTQNGHYPPEDNREYIISYIPGVEPISTKDLMSHLQEADTGILHKFVFRAFEEVVKADFILHNTVQELESNTLSALNQKQPTYAIGPVNFQAKINVSKSMLSEIDCSNWLASKPPGSVLYVSFGSYVQTNKKIIQEIAQGLLLSEVNFIWAIRPKIVGLGSTGVSDILPVEFENNVVKDRGLVVPWCNQVDVLSNPAIGGFLTHCGWNSILEGIWCGVPMICYPSGYDQPTNRKLVVNDWRIGINLCDRVSINGEEVAEKIKKLMSGEISDGLRNEMKKISTIFHNALAEDGSSQRNLDRFLDDLDGKLLAKEKECTKT